MTHWRCLWYGHDWQAWSGAREIATYTVDMDTGRRIGSPGIRYEQYRTCARCGTQQTRHAEPPPDRTP